ncbi:hypothetical protein L6452_18498 [Arctium lappa]|uniref:Uncharacterized protein n=1 Tax=Arctium lappa TaxID=4217 RepID=A0ACB9C662_ARCLA|nr:hypothetical protein L6452_18498 [Arctium lappa]
MAPTPSFDLYRVTKPRTRLGPSLRQNVTLALADLDQLLGLNIPPKPTPTPVITSLEKEEHVDGAMNMETKAEVVKNRITRTKTRSKRKRNGSEQHKEEANVEHQEEPNMEEQEDHVGDEQEQPQIATRKKKKLSKEGISNYVKLKHLFSSSLAKNNYYAFAKKTGVPPKGFPQQLVLATPCIKAVIEELC